MGRDEISDENENGHDDMLGNGNDVGAGDFGHGDSAVGLIGGIEVDMVRADASRDGELEFLGFGKTLRSEVAGVEAVEWNRV